MESDDRHETVQARLTDTDFKSFSERSREKIGR